MLVKIQLLAFFYLFKTQKLFKLFLEVFNLMNLELRYVVTQVIIFQTDKNIINLYFGMNQHLLANQTLPLQLFNLLTVTTTFLIYNFVFAMTKQEISKNPMNIMNQLVQLNLMMITIYIIKTTLRIILMIINNNLPKNKPLLIQWFIF